MRRRRSRRRRWRGLLKIGTFLVLMAGSCLLVLVVAIFLLGPPSLDRTQNTIYYSNDGEVIGEEFGTEKRYWVSIDEIDDHLKEAIIQTEDQHFYDHFGFDLKRLGGAIWNNIRTMSLKEGASTITQQYARNLFLSHDKTWKRKLYEAFYTMRLEMFYDKDELLEGYLNTIYFGHGAYGIEAASRLFFDQSAKDLNWSEAAMLAGIPKGPSHYSPFHDYDKAKGRQELILANLRDRNVIDANTYETAVAETLAFSDDRDITTKSMAPYFQDVVANELQERLDIDIEDVHSGGYQVYTTLDTSHQQAMEEATERMDADSDIQIGAASMEPDSGAITALVGGRNYASSSFNRVTQAKRMPGSAFKPFLYYAALENGMTAATALMSKPTTFELADGNSYQPSNYHDYYANQPITMAQAIALSDNIYAVKTNLYVTPERFARLAHEKFKFESELEPVASLALGTEVVTMDEMITGYSIIANGGIDIEPHTITKITDAHGEILYEKEQDTADEGWSLFSKQDDRQLLRQDYAYILTDMMKGMFQEELNGYMSVTGASIADELTHEYAGKSGTTNVDNWMVGFSPSLTAGVWIGYDDNREIVQTNEQQYAKEIWAHFMELTHEDTPDTHPVKPDNVVEVAIDLNTGYLASEECGTSYTMPFVKGTEPIRQCTPNAEANDYQYPDIPESHLLENWWEWLWRGEQNEG
ncbi:PBP1A family penicillin-binding protein [Gracilibacillus sp. S3-1-1]|uniref:PBP1A family penicillin-binding protein n=1 Tax=Gracilibacillus pellucidus TaxID=3095368 RepID=A0ACC6M269_9BACI|nr:PBP1A family penicillin-binding protein [Gracilibacillus sp. S3-1-1]MDX8045041.1 PBP1A family penicillin-binding protein [Gracilibacillus sp. S3-1-1]